MKRRVRTASDLHDVAVRRLCLSTCKGATIAVFGMERAFRCGCDSASVVEHVVVPGDRWRSLLFSLWCVYYLRVRGVEQHQVEIRALNEQLIKAQEAERMRISGSCTTAFSSRSLPLLSG